MNIVAANLNLSLKNEINQDIVSVIIALLNKQGIMIGGGGEGTEPVVPTLPALPTLPTSISPQTIAQLAKLLPKDFKFPTA